MAKMNGQQLVTEICNRMAWDSTVGAARAEALKLVQEADNWLSTLASHKYLERTESLILPVAANTVAVPGWVDIGKQMSIELGDAPVDILPSDKLKRNSRHTYGAWGLASPTTCSIRGNNVGALSFVFKSANATAGNLEYTLTAQQIRVPVLDDPASFLMVPEPYETTIVLKQAEFEGKADIRAIVTDAERKELADVVQRFLDQFRAGREVPKPDSEAVKRKQSEAVQEAR